MNFGFLFMVGVLTVLSILTLLGAILGILAFMRQGQTMRKLAKLRADFERLESRLEAPAARPQKPVIQPEPPPLEPASPVQTATPSTPPAPPATALSAPQAASGRLRWLEELAGGMLSVLLGGLLLAMGGVLLVRFTIEEGLLGPAGRIALGASFSVALAAGGEYLRRGDLRMGRVAWANAYVPGALTGAAIVSAFATIYAAYSLYGFIGATTAFGLLAACSLAGLAVSSIHGPGLAALGLLGSYATPAMIHSQRPDAWLLFGYLLIISFACFFTAHLRNWLWLAVAASAAADFWAAAWLLDSGDVQAWAVAVYLAALALLTVLLLRKDRAPSQAGNSGGAVGLALIDRPLTAMLGGHSVIGVVLAATDGLSAPSLWALIAVGLILAWAAWSWRSLALAPAAGGIATVLSYALASDPLGPLLGGTLPSDTASLLWTGALLGAGYGAGGTAGFFGRRSNAVWPCVATAVPLAIFAYAYGFSAEFQISPAFAALGGGLAIAFAVAAETANRRPGNALADWGVAIYAAAAVAALALGLAMGLEKGWLTVALAAMAPGLAIIERQRSVPILRWLIAVLAGLVALRLIAEPSIIGGNPGATPIFNWLLYAYGLPTLAFWFAARELLKRRDDLPVKIAEGASLAFLAGLIGTEIRHLMTEGAMTSAASLAEYGLHTVSWLGLAIGLRLRAGGDFGRAVPRYAGLGFGGLGIVAMLGNTLLLQNPVLTGIPVGSGLIFNDLFVAYLLPAALTGLLYRVLKGASPWWLRAVPATAGLVMAFAYLTLEVGRWFEGPVIAMSQLSPGELYALSLVWLLFALGLLTAGIRFDNAVLRQAAFGVLLLVTLKVFLVDLSGLTGLLQAGSFIGLGLALIGIGLAYQRLVLRAGRPPPRA